METSILVGYFVKRDEALGAYRKLQRKGFRRAAVVSKTADGVVRTKDPFPRRRAFGAMIAFVLFGIIAYITSMTIQRPESILSGIVSTLIPILAGGFVGIFLSGMRVRRSRFGVDRSLLKDHSRWLVAEETALILQTPVNTVRIPMAVLVGSGETVPTVFVLHPKREKLIEDATSPAVPLSPEQIQEHAKQLAEDHPADPHTERNSELLERVEQARKRIRQVCSDLSEASKLEQSTPPTAEWLLDNEYVIESNARDVQLNLPRRYYQTLPALTEQPYRGLPRIYSLAKELVSHTDLRLDQENTLAFIEAYQSVHALTIGELWAMPQMLRIALIESIQSLAVRARTELREREIADFWANRLIAVNRRDPNQLFSVLAELAENQSSPSAYFTSQLIDHLYDEEAALVPVQSWLEHTLRLSLDDINLQEQNRQTKDRISIGNAFDSLRQLALEDWRKIFEKLSRVEQLLRRDPSGVYPKMDFDTRDRYRRAVEELARGSDQSEARVAQRAVELAGQAAGEAKEDERPIHVGTYLVGGKRHVLARLIRGRETLRFRALRWIYRHHTAVYLIGLLLFTAVFIFSILRFGLQGQSPTIQIMFALLLLIPASQLSLDFLNYFLMRLLPPRALPKMDFEFAGIPDAFRTLVVVPVLLVDAAKIRKEVEKLEIRYLANKEANLLFSLFTDYTDCGQAHCEEDQQLLQVALESLEALNHRYGAGRFFLFHRERRWSETERQFIGWERKRGKLEELNRLIDGTRSDDAQQLVYVGDRDLLFNVRFIITLDSDTQLPHGAARRMIETLAHPLNQPRFSPDGDILAGSYALIQPRVSPSLPSTSATPFSRLFSDPVGIDPYTRIVSDVNQDLTGEGSYHGKGIYDVRAFSRVLSGRFPEGRLLSHDLIEGAHVRVGLASDIELYDDVPQDYLSYTVRQHRWIRGDWQIADWVLPRVPQPGKRRGPNQLSWFNRWKVLDNLRRSLVPVAALGLLAISWLVSSPAGWISTVMVAVMLLFHPIAQHLTLMTSHLELKSFSFSKLMHDLLRSVVEAALLPHQAGLALDAIARVLYRRLVSHRWLLEWTPAKGGRGSASGRLLPFVASMGAASVFSGVVGWTVYRWMPSNLVMAGPWLVMWFLSPLLGWLLNLRLDTNRNRFPLPAEDMEFLRDVARRTWRYFSDFVTDETSWLPPDNYQIFHQNRLAMRTSPTNIGLWMLSAIAAQEFGYLTVDQVVEKLSHTMETISKLERYEGHLLNWYDIKTLTALEPRYVSTVDSGNLLGALWTLEQGLEKLIERPVLDAKAFDGLRDTGKTLKLAVEREGFTSFDVQALDELLDAWESPPEQVADSLHLLKRTKGIAATLVNEGREPAGADAEVVYWALQVEGQASAWVDIAERYLAWVGVLNEKTEEEVAGLGQDALVSFHHALRHAPSLFDLANGHVDFIEALQAKGEEAHSVPGSLQEWRDRLIRMFETSKWLAGEVLGLGKQLVRNVRELSASADLRFLYDPERRLFSIGFNVSEGRLDRAYYDLLASEARLGSLVAMARGDVPIDHWFSMSRPYRAIGRNRVLLSWTGTMFEYLMPLIFHHSYGNSLLDKAAREAVAIQIAYGRRRRVPWGFSESAFGDLDLNQTYQYKAFGVPALGLKRGLEEELVVAPYASLLAVSVAPRQAIRNLHRLDGLGLLGDYGYYESMDFSRQPSITGERGLLVQSYMAHHQGMGLLSLANFLRGSMFQRLFHAEARVIAVEPVLQERVPVLPPLHLISMQERNPSQLGIGETAPSESKFDTPHTATPKTQILSNGRYSVMVTNAGGGYSHWAGREITRWSSDRTRDSWGTFCYIHEQDSDRLWSNTYHPTGGKAKSYTAHFALGRAVFSRTDNGIQTETEVIVSSEDDVEVRRIVLTNRSIRTRRLDLTSYVELSMAPHNADRQHPAFNKLFIQTEGLPEHQSLLAYRRSRNQNDQPIYVAHRFTAERSEDEDFRFETDRRRFIGRGHTLENPMGASQELSNSEGFVLDPILSLRRSVTLGPGQRVQVSMVLAAGETRLRVLEVMSKYGDPHAIDRAMDFSWASAQLELRLLHIQPDEARRFQYLASHLLYPNPHLRPPGDRIEETGKGQRGLWPYGISGDVPIALITIGEERDISLVRQMLQAHAYWRRHGLTADLVVLNEEASGYEHPLRERLERLIQTHSTFTGVDQPGGIHLRSADLFPEEDLRLLKAASSMVLVAARGTLLQGVSVVSPEVPETFAKKQAPRQEPSASLPFMELPYFNSLGGFTPDGHEYVIYLGPGTNTPAPWVNVIANPTFGTLLSETGSGFTWYGNSQRNRLTQWSNDPVVDPPSEALYIRDEDTGVFWTPTSSPIREQTPYRTRHGAGYTVFEHNSHEIEQELTVFVPVDEKGGEPIKLQRLRLRNDSARHRRLSVTYYVEWTLGENRESSQLHVVTSWDDKAQALLARNNYHPDYGDRISFAAVSPPTESYSADRTSFLGRNRSMGSPAAMERTGLSRRTGAGFDPCAALQTTFELAPGEKTEITCMLGQDASMEEARGRILSYREDLKLETALTNTKSWWDDLLGAIEVHTPELAADFLINRWLQYQSLSCRIWGRSAFYQSGGAFGFRDQLQDIMAFLYTQPELARQHILLAASRQFKEGDVQHWWHPPGGAGVRSRISDDLLWLPYAVAHYIRTTGDSDILHTEMPFLNAPVLEEVQHELFSVPEVTLERATLFEHCKRAITKGLTVGPQGLPLMGTGDWNDGMNLVGAGGKGESVWLAWFLVEVLDGMAALADLMDQPDLSRAYRREREGLVQNIERTAWDGEWYLRATFDDGTPLGSAEAEEAKVASIPQSWAWLSGAADPDRADRALESAWKHLVRDDDGVVLLFSPPFDQFEPSPGYIKGYPPGVRENGGQYTHAALWLAMAMARKGDGERAAKILRLINPIEHARDPETVWRYGVEPYVIAADVYRLPGRVGQGGWSWYTGSAAWMYRAWVEEVLGLKIRGDHMQIDPVIPGWWEGFGLRYRHGESIYDIQVENPEGYERGVSWLEMDGQHLPDGVIQLELGLVKHRVLVRMGKPADSRPRSGAAGRK